VEEHGRKEAERLGLIGHEVDEDPGEPDRLAGELGPDEGVAGRRLVTLVEDEVEDAEDRVEALGQEVVRRDPVRDRRIAHLPLRPHESLGERHLGDEEGAGDLRGGQPAEGPQGKGDLRLHRQSRMTAGEDEAESVVDDGAHLDRPSFPGRQLGGDGGLVREQRPLLLEAPGPAEPIDRPIARRGRDPGTRVVGHAVARPAFEGDDERLLDRLLGEVEVAEDADKGRDRAARFLAEQAVDDGVGVRRWRQRPRWRPAAKSRSGGR
jgi:hypothetical protein